MSIDTRTNTQVNMGEEESKITEFQKEKQEFVKKVKNEINKSGTEGLLKLVKESVLGHFDEEIMNNLQKAAQVLVLLDKKGLTKTDLHKINADINSVAWFDGFMQGEFDKNLHQEILNIRGAEKFEFENILERLIRKMEVVINELLLKGMKLENQDDVNLLKEYGYPQVSRNLIGKTVKLDTHGDLYVQEGKKMKKINTAEMKQIETNEAMGDLKKELHALMAEIKKTQTKES